MCKLSNDVQIDAASFPNVNLNYPRNTLTDGESLTMADTWGGEGGDCPQYFRGQWSFVLNQWEM